VRHRGTVADFPFEFDGVCVTTPDTTVGIDLLRRDDR
jgi:hypothetical protein